MILATRLAAEATAFCRSAAGRGAANRKADQSVVTATDHAIQAHILKVVSRAYPQHAVVAEEAVGEPSVHADLKTSRYCWVVDPLDGTRNYVAGFPCFATSIAVLDRGDPVVAVVVEHNLGQVSTAIRGEGAMCNGRPVQVAEPRDDEDWLVGIPSTKDRLTVDIARRWIAMPGLVFRNMGSTAFHLAMIAAGGLCAAYCKRCKIWDLAAGVLLVREAGGMVTDPAGMARTPFALDGDLNEDLPFMVGAPKVHARLLESIRDLVAMAD